MSAVPDQDMLQIDDLDQFVKHLTLWHNAKVAMLNHMLKVPEGTEAELNEGEKIILNGDMLKGFRVGVTLGLTELGTLPFVAEMTDSSTAVKH